MEIPYWNETTLIYEGEFVLTYTKQIPKTVAPIMELLKQDGWRNNHRVYVPAELRSGGLRKIVNRINSKLATIAFRLRSIDDKFVVVEYW